jgi:uncharacterized protein involved in outer membrane biogenesis
VALSEEDILFKFVEARLKRFVYGVGALLGLVLAIIVIAPSFVDWNQYRDEIAQQVEDLVGRPVTIEGDLDFAILPSPALSAKNLRIANIPGASTVDLVTLEALDIEVAFMPLLRGTFQVERTVLVGPVINLETLMDGRNNWDQPEDLMASGETTSDGVGFQVTLDSLLIRNGALNYVDAGTGVARQVQNINAAVSAKTIWGPYKIQGDVQYDGILAAIDLAVGDVSKSRLPVEAKISLPEGGLAGTLSGVGYLDETDLLFDGTIDLLARDSRQLIGILTDNDTIQNETGVPVSLSGRASITNETTSFEKVDISYGDVIGQGELGITHGETSSYTAILSLPVIDLNDLMADVEHVLAGSGEKSGEAGFELPANVDASLDVTIEGLRFDGRLARQVRLAAVLGNQQVSVASLRALMPGGSDISVSGTLTAEKGQPNFAGQLRAGSSNLRTMLTAFEIDVAAIPQDRLTQMIMSSALAYNGDTVQFGNLELKVDTTTITGGLAYALGRDRPSIGFDLTADRFNADAYMTRETAGDEQSFDMLDLVNDLLAIDASGTLMIEQLSYQRESLTGLSAAIDVSKDRIVLSSVRSSNVAGANVALSDFVLSGGETLGVRGRLAIETEDFPRLRRFADVGALPVGLNAQHLALDTDFTLAGHTINLDGQAVLDDTRLGIRSKLTELPDGGTESNMQVELTSPSWQQVTAITGLEVASPAPDFDGPVSVRGTIIGQRQTYDFNLGMELGGGKASVSGKVEAGIAPTGLNLSASIQAQDMVPMMGALGFELRSDSLQNKPLKLSAKVNGWTDRFTIDDLSGVLGPTSFKGQATADLRGEVPEIVATLEFDTFDLGSLMGPAETGAQEAHEDQQLRWSSDKIDLSSLELVNATVALSARQLDFHNYKFVGPKMQVKISGGGLQVPSMSAKLFGGDMTFRGGLENAGKPALAAFFSLTNASLAQALAATADLTVATGKLSVSANMQSRGDSQKALISGLAGNVDLLAENGVVQGVDMVRMSETMLSLAEYDDFIKLLGTALEGGETRYERFHAPFKLANGVATTGPEIAVLEASQATVNATIDLPRWALDADIEFKLTEPGHENTPSVGLRLYGSIDNPQQQTRAKAMTAYISRGLANRLLQDFSDGGGNSGLRQLLGAPATKPLSPTGEQAAPPSPTEAETSAPPPSNPGQPTQTDTFEQLMQGLFNEIEREDEKSKAKEAQP